MGSDEYVLDTPVVRELHRRRARRRSRAPRRREAACDAIRPAFAELLADPDVAARRATRRATPESGMGGGIGQWLLFRAGDRSLTLFALVVPPGAQTPVHDHLAWGLVGLYRGTQDEEIYARATRSRCASAARSRPATSTRCCRPRDDIHRVRTTSAETSVSIHLLTNDTGCVWRHAYDAESGEVTPFRSGYVNVLCDDRLRGCRPAAIPAYPSERECATSTSPGYRHEALFYRGDEEFLAGTVPLVRDAVDADAAGPRRRPARARARAAGGARPRRASASRSPTWRSSAATRARIIRRVARLRRARTPATSAAPLGIGEPIWPERTRGRARRVPAPRDAAEPRLPARDAVDAAVPLRRRAARPTTCSRRRGATTRTSSSAARLRRSGAYARAIPGAEPLPAAGRRADGAALRRTASSRSCASSSAAARRARGLRRPSGSADLVLAVDELATNSAALRPRRGHAAHLARERHAARRGRRRGAHRGPAGRPRLPRPGASSAAAACTWSTSSATWCSCAPRPRAA